MECGNVNVSKPKLEALEYYFRIQRFFDAKIIPSYIEKSEKYLKNEVKIKKMPELHIKLLSKNNINTHKIMW